MSETALFKFSFEKEWKESSIPQIIKDEENKSIEDFLKICNKNNENVVKQFNQHAELLSKILNYPKENILISGSRSMNICYPESDIDFVIISDKEQEKLQNSLKCFYEKHCFNNEKPIVKSLITKAGLRVLVVSNFEDENLYFTKLDISFRTKEFNEKTQNVMKKSFENWNERMKYEYLWCQRKLFLLKESYKYNELFSKLEKEYCDNKEWMKKSFLQNSI
jgi:hypothetical protein